MNILLFFPNRIENAPPIISGSITLSSLGTNVNLLVTSLDANNEKLLKTNNIKIYSVSEQLPRNFILKVLERIRVIITFFKLKRSVDPDVIWFVNSHYYSYDAFLPKSSKYIRVSQMLENDQHHKRRFFFHKISMRKADICVVPEINRLWLLKIESGSKAFFYVVPNRLHKSLITSLRIEDEVAKSYFVKNGGNPNCEKFVIYQGALMRERCITNLISAFKMIENKTYGLIILGKIYNDDFSKEIKRQIYEDNRIVLIDFVEPPNHLRITASCDIGVILYAPISLNNIYCAPNKIFEYASYGLAQLLPNYPGLENINSLYNIGANCDPEDPFSIKSALSRLMDRSKEISISASKNFLNKYPSLEYSYQEVINKIEELKK